jgi:hypothetical protein
MLNIKTLNEEWEQRIKWLSQRSFSETDTTRSISLWYLARKSEAIRLEWLEQILE